MFVLSGCASMGRTCLHMPYTYACVCVCARACTSSNTLWLAAKRLLLPLVELRLCPVFCRATLGSQFWAVLAVFGGAAQEEGLDQEVTAQGQSPVSLWQGSCPRSAARRGSLLLTARSRPNVASSSLRRLAGTSSLQREKG